MALPGNSDVFWERVERDMQKHHPISYFFHAQLLRGGILVILFTAVYLVLGTILEPARGYFLSHMEVYIHPVYWTLGGIVLIICGAILRFRAMGPVIEKMKMHDEKYT